VWCQFLCLITIVTKGCRWDTTGVYTTVLEPRGLVEIKTSHITWGLVLVFERWVKGRTRSDAPNNALCVLVNVLLQALVVCIGGVWLCHRNSSVHQILQCFQRRLRHL